MKQITEIIDILSDENVNLENALIKTKVLMHRMGEQGAVEWINKELTGYSDQEEIPEYRVITARLQVTAADGVQQWNKMPAPIGHLTEKERSNITKVEMSQSISAIEHLAQGDGNTLTRDISPEYWSKLSEPLSPGIEIQRAWSEVAKSQVLEINTIIRSRLLDFVLQLEAKIPTGVDIEEAKTKAKDIGAGDLFNSAMFGDNTTIIVGDHNTQSINNSVVKNDLDSLIKLLGEKGVSEADTNALKSAVQSDSSNIDLVKKEYGPAVKCWVKTMMDKAVDGTWTIGLDAAGSLLTTALTKFYGFS